MLTNSVSLVVGLGNPGREYSRTRHNVGFMALDQIAAAFHIPVLQNKFDALIGQGMIERKRVILAKPQAYMNRSGVPVQRLLHFYKASYEKMIVLHDDIDLIFGKIKIKTKGGHGGHKGIQSIMESTGAGSFTRLRIGIGRPESKMEVSDYVLGRFTPDEQASLGRILDAVQEALVTILRAGAEEGMNRFNNQLFS